MTSEVLFDQKWMKLLKLDRLFRYIPFIDFVLAAGSMAMGNVKPESDFDVIIGARYGRIFTARFFSVWLFGLFGWRRKKITHRDAAKDKICLNHFVTEKSYCFSPPHNDYWRDLYLNLIPVFGKHDVIQAFYKANSEWLTKSNSLNKTSREYSDDLRHQYKEPSFFKKFLEYVLGGKIGDYLEKLLKFIQIRRIKTGLERDKQGYKPRIRYSDSELEFHPDTKRTEA